MARVDTAFRPLRARHHAETVSALRDVFTRMQEDVQARKDSGLKRLISPRWDKELAGVVLDRNMATATEVALRVIKALKPSRRVLDDDQDWQDYDPDVMAAWLAANAQIAAKGINQHAQDMLDEAESDDADPVIADDPVGHVFGILLASGAEGLAQQMVTSSAGFATQDATYASGVSASKSWQVNSGNPRSAHAAMNGETVSMSENFSNGMAWPGDPEGGPDDNAGCQCSLTILSG